MDISLPAEFVEACKKHACVVMRRRLDDQRSEEFASRIQFRSSAAWTSSVTPVKAYDWVLQLPTDDTHVVSVSRSVIDHAATTARVSQVGFGPHAQEYIVSDCQPFEDHRVIQHLMQTQSYFRRADVPPRDELLFEISHRNPETHDTSRVLPSECLRDEWMAYKEPEQGTWVYVNGYQPPARATHTCVVRVTKKQTAKASKRVKR